MIRIILFIIVMGLVTTSCNKEPEVLTMDMSSEEEESGTLSKGIGPISKVELGDIDSSLVERGKKVFERKCLACHHFDEKIVGPALDGVTERRSPEWIMNMILNTNEMVEKDPIVKSMIAEYMTKMTFQDVSKDDARAMLEYFRQNDANK